MASLHDELIQADWPAPDAVRAYTTTRMGGVSVGAFDSWNLALHVQDHAAHVTQNRQILADRLGLQAQPWWLEQVHGTAILDIDETKNRSSSAFQADGSYTRLPNQVCVVMTADCLPVLLCNRSASEVAAVHAGWKGLAAGVLEAAVQKFRSPASDIMAWLGPAIGPQSFEVGDEVRQAFVQQNQQTAQAFTKNPNGQYMADLYALARIRLSHCGVNAVYGGGECTYQQQHKYFSYRRDQQTGRMASLIWIVDKVFASAPG